MGKSKKKGPQKHVPERTCIACRAKRPKRALIRVVRTVEHEIVIDERGKINGRGAYLCAQQACWQRALKRGSLNRALKITLDDETIAELQVYAASLPATLAET